jgi:hypothetical protein
MEQNEKITAVYCRTATPDPAAIETQRESLLRHAAAQGFGDVEVFEDDGFSGNDPARPAFALLNKLIAAGQVARVLAQSLSRLGRNAAEVLAWARAAQARGVEVKPLNMGAGTLPAQFMALEAAAPSADPEPGPEETDSLPERFAIWLLTGPEGGAFTFTLNDCRHAVIRVRKSADFDYLYFQRNPIDLAQSEALAGGACGDGIERGDSFQYAGIYCGGATAWSTTTSTGFRSSWRRAVA